MVDSINGGNTGKTWEKIGNAIVDTEYLKGLDKKINSIMKGKKEIDVNQIKSNSVFKDLSGEALIRFNQIVGSDGNAKTISRDELRILYAMTDAQLENNTFKFDLEMSNPGDSALQEATPKEYQAFIENLTPKDSATRHIKTTDTSKFDKTKPFSEKIKSDNPDEVMTAVNDELMTNYVNPKTGKKMAITEIVSLVSKYVNENKYMDYDDICKNLNKELGINMSDYGRYRGSGDYYKIGDWEIDSHSGITNTKTISNAKTGQAIKGQDAHWARNTAETIPNTRGFVFMIDEYSDKEGNVVKFNRQKEVDTIQPSSATVYGSNGNVQNVKYDIEESLDPKVYNFVYED